MSGHAIGVEVELDRVVDPDHVGPVGVRCDRELLAFANAVETGRPDLDAARAAVVDAVGDDGLLESSATIAIFNGLVRVADGTGIALDEGLFASSLADRERLGLDRFAGVANTPPHAPPDGPMAPPAEVSIRDLFG